MGTPFWMAPEVGWILTFIMFSCIYLFLNFVGCIFAVVTPSPDLQLHCQLKSAICSSIVYLQLIQSFQCFFMLWSYGHLICESVNNMTAINGRERRSFLISRREQMEDEKRNWICAATLTTKRVTFEPDTFLNLRGTKITSRKGEATDSSDVCADSVWRQRDQRHSVLIFSELKLFEEERWIVYYYSSNDRKIQNIFCWQLPAMMAAQ